MNIPDEYWTTEVPDGVDICAIKWRSGTVEAVSIHVARVFACEPDAMGVRFCPLAPAAEVERLKAENAKLRGWVQDAYGEGRYSTAHWDASTTRARLDGRAET